MVERSLSMREVPGSMPGFSIFFSLAFFFSPFLPPPPPSLFSFPLPPPPLLLFLPSLPPPYFPSIFWLQSIELMRYFYYLDQNLSSLIKTCTVPEDEERHYTLLPWL